MRLGSVLSQRSDKEGALSKKKVRENRRGFANCKKIESECRRQRYQQIDAAAATVRNASAWIVYAARISTWSSAPPYSASTTSREL